MVQESQAAGLAANGVSAETGEAYGVVVGIGIEFGHHPEPLGDTVVVDSVHICLAVRFYIGIIFGTYGAEDAPEREHTAGEYPFRQVIAFRKAPEGRRRDGPDKLLEFVKVPGACRFLSGLRVRHHEIPEAELPFEILSELLNEGLGGFKQETGAQPLGHLSHTGLRGLHKKRHTGIVLAHQLAEVHPRVYLLGR